MYSMEIVLLGLALAIDAAVVSFAIGLLNPEAPLSQKIFRGSALAMVFGLFQFLMLWLGSYGGFVFTFSSYGYLFQFIVASVFFVIGLKFFTESVGEEKRQVDWKVIPLLILALATSIDALAAGISLGTLPNAYLAAIEVGIITAITCGGFYAMAQFFKYIPEKWLLRIASLIFFGLGTHTIWDYIITWDLTKGFL